MIKLRIDIDAAKLNSWMKKHYPGLTLSHLQKLCRIGEIRINGGRAKYNDVLARGDELKLPPYIVEYEKPASTRRYSQKEKDEILARIVFQDDEMLAIDKPAGLAAQGGTGVEASVDELANEALPDYCGSLRLVHRIDKETSGILILAKSREAAQSLTKMFKDKEMAKTYLALVHGSLKNKKGSISTPIEEDGRQRSALTEYKVLDEASGLLSLVELAPMTGRTHQLRVHMKSIGHPIVGDFKYAPEGEFSKLRNALGIPLARQMYLHAWRVKVPGRRIITAPVPEYMGKIMKYLDMGAGK
ncbi:MAG: RluA family pseudouridine synthase [Rickettsiales bacterium]|jgi:23S rRNA pseudouridine955/2504/2580 synthase|nr:RluA family pseudouridine synthase [Rickettsiales bacterium]